MALDNTEDTEGNTATEVNFKAPPVGESNPHGNAILTEETPLLKEAEAQREMNLASSRFWESDKSKSDKCFWQTRCVQTGARFQRAAISTS